MPVSTADSDQNSEQWREAHSLCPSTVLSCPGSPHRESRLVSYLALPYSSCWEPVLSNLGSMSEFQPACWGVVLSPDVNCTFPSLKGHTSLLGLLASS